MIARRYAYYIAPTSKLTVEQAEARICDHDLARSAKRQGLSDAILEEGVIFCQIHPGSLVDESLKATAAQIGAEVRTMTVDGAPRSRSAAAESPMPRIPRRGVRASRPPCGLPPEGDDDMMDDKEKDAAAGFVVTREDLEETLEANGYEQGKADPDPDKDASFMWYGHNKWVRFSVPDDGKVLYGDLTGDGYLTYNSLFVVLAGIKSLAEAKLRPTFQLPDSVAKKLQAAHQAAGENAPALPAAETALALAAAGSDAEEPTAPRPKPSSKKDDGIFNPKTPGRGGVF